MSIRALLLYSPAGSGHRVAAHAIAEAIGRRAPDAAVEVRDVLDFAPRWFRYDRLWSLIQRHAAPGWDWCFDATDARGALGLDHLRLPLHRALFAALDRHLVASRPTHVIATHYLPAVAVARLRRTGALTARAITTITDHRVHQAWVNDGLDGYAVADEAAARALARRCDAPIAITGIPIAARAGAPVVAVARDTATPRVLVLLGGVPAADAIAALAALAPLARRGARLEVITGGVDAVAAAARTLGPAATVVARADGLWSSLDACDLVVTKAGGLVVSECLARGRAMVLPFAAPGQERGNLEHALACGAGVRPRELADLGHVVRALAGEPGRLRRMSALARLASRPDAADAAAAFALADADLRRERHAA